MSMFLICSQGVLYSGHESSILTCPQAPAGHGALRAGGCAALVSGTGGGDRARAAARSRRAVQRQRPVRSRGAGRVRRRLAESRRIAAIQDHCRARHRAQGHHPQQLARYRFRSLDQSLSGLRTWLRLLLRAADPCLSRPVAGARLRIEAVCQARCAGAAGKGTGGPGLRTAHDRDRHQHRPLPADRARAADHARHSRGARSRRPSGRHRHQIGAGHPRHRHSRADGKAQSRQGGALGHDARRDAGAHHGAARLDPAKAARGAAAAVRSGDSDHGDGGAGDTRAERFRDRAHSRRRGACRRQGSELCAAAAAARSARPVPRMADRRTIPTATVTSSR